MQTIIHEIRRFVIDNFLFGQKGDSLRDDESFLDSGIIDSTGVLELVGFLETRYGIAIADHELIPDNLDSVSKVARFILAKRDACPAEGDPCLTLTDLPAAQRQLSFSAGGARDSMPRARRSASAGRNSGHRVEALRRRGVVLGLVGGHRQQRIAALCVRALGPERVVGPADARSGFCRRVHGAGADCSAAAWGSERFSKTSRQSRGGGLLPPPRRRDHERHSRAMVPGASQRLCFPPDMTATRCKLFSVVVELPNGEQRRARLSSDAYLAIVAATNFKQRVRKMMEYHYADLLQYCVVGTPNRLEYDQGFFVKLGDGAADLKPIAHLYKTQVYQLAEYLGIPDEIRRRPPTTDTYSLPQSQEEFYFSASATTSSMSASTG